MLPLAHNVVGPLVAYAAVFREVLSAYPVCAASASSDVSNLGDAIVVRVGLPRNPGDLGLVGGPQVQWPLLEVGMAVARGKHPLRTSDVSWVAALGLRARPSLIG